MTDISIFQGVGKPERKVTALPVNTRARLSIFHGDNNELAGFACDFLKPKTTGGVRLLVTDPDNSQAVVEVQVKDGSWAGTSFVAFNKKGRWETFNAQEA